MMYNLFNNFPTAQLADLPTPIVSLAKTGKKFSHDRLFMKRDDLSSPAYGGNKIRKLEFLLGEALAEGRRSVITYGAAGSNHALATAVCCQRLGLDAISILVPQEPSEHVRKNILMGHAVGAELHLCKDYTEFPERTESIVSRCLEQDGIVPYIIPAGGTNTMGALGFVKAAFELSTQQRPDVVYVPMGTGGTYAGLLVGFLLLGWQPRIEAIRVVDRDFRDEIYVKKLCDELCETFGVSSRVSASDIVIRDEFYGEGYGVPTLEGQAAIHDFRELEGVEFENTYTGKTGAALLSDLKNGRLAGQTVLYWNTLSSCDFSAAIAQVDFHDLPAVFWPYFIS